MKKANPLALLPTEELIARRKKNMSAAIGLGIVMSLAAVFLIYRAITSNQPALIAVAIGCSMTFLPILISLGQLNKEIKSRTN